MEKRAVVLVTGKEFIKDRTGVVIGERPTESLLVFDLDTPLSSVMRFVESKGTYKAGISFETEVMDKGLYLVPGEPN